MHEVEFIRYVCIYAYVKSGCAARVYRPPRVLLLPLPSFPCTHPWQKGPYWPICGWMSPPLLLLSLIQRTSDPWEHPLGLFVRFFQHFGSLHLDPSLRWYVFHCSFLWGVWILNRKSVSWPSFNFYSLFSASPNSWTEMHYASWFVLIFSKCIGRIVIWDGESGKQPNRLNLH